MTLILTVLLFLIFNVCVEQTVGLNEDVHLSLYGNQHANTLSVDLSCGDIQEKFSSLVSATVKCAVENARPITICRNCALQYNATNSAFQDLRNHSFGAVKCKEIFFEEDSLSVVQIVFSSISNLWKKSNCAACYKADGDNTDYSELSAGTKRFISSLVEFNICVNKSAESNKSVCTSCGTVYKNLTDVYSEIIKDNADGSNGICWDILDSINSTQHIWSDKYHCKHFLNKFIGIPNIIISVVVMLLPFTFYIIMRFLSVRDHLEIFRTKRRSFARSDSTQPT